MQYSSIILPIFFYTYLIIINFQVCVFTPPFRHPDHEISKNLLRQLCVPLITVIIIQEVIHETF